MSIWILHQRLTSQEEDTIRQRDTLELPFNDVPDLSEVSSPAQCRQLMQSLHPDDPPEALRLKTERVWTLFSGLQREDIVAVPLQQRRQLALAEVTGRYRYEVAADGADRHLIPVTWVQKPVPFRALREHKEWLDPKRDAMFEINDAKARIAIRDRLPHSYNRFARFKWVFVVLMVVIGIVRLVTRIEHN